MASAPAEGKTTEPTVSVPDLENSNSNGPSDGPKRITLRWTSVRRADIEPKNLPINGSLNSRTRAGNFWHGALLPTFSKHADDSPETFDGLHIMFDVIGVKKLSSDDTQVTLCSDLLFAIVSSFITEADCSWIRSRFPPGVPVILIHHPGEDGMSKVTPAQNKWVYTCPGLGGWGCMHVKLMMLFYKSGRLRVVISSANCVYREWNEAGNIAWMQDIPPAEQMTPEGSPQDGSTSGPGLQPRTEPESFQDGLVRVLKALNVPAALEMHLEAQKKDGGVPIPIRTIDDLTTGWDWSRVKAHLVSSIFGKHSGWSDINKVGHAALAAAVNRLGFQGQFLQLEYQGSSIGNYTPEWLDEFVTSARGTLPNKRPYRPQRRKVIEPPAGLKIIYPTEKTVIGSVTGQEGGLGLLGFRKEYWDKPRFPRRAFANSVSKQGNIVMHSKMILALTTKSVAEQSPALPRGWLYAGSHNFSPSAWGKISGGFSPTLEVANYELGVVIPITNEEEGDELACWRRPPRMYAREDKPWSEVVEEGDANEAEPV